ncbi:hypothetical protein F5884DRAFT_747184 [Xylogone sp. PMI_703]|nr:hypothetical protein F5884DRAFT_747184 [Xylogone sp. PMI_703]
MSSMIKKKGALSFKPKAPQIRRPPASTSTPSSARPSVERQVQAPAPTIVSTEAESVSATFVDSSAERISASRSNEALQTEITTTYSSSADSASSDKTAVETSGLKRKAITDEQTGQLERAKKKPAHNISTSGLRHSGETIPQTSHTSSQTKESTHSKTPINAPSDSETPVALRSTIDHNREETSEIQSEGLRGVGRGEITVGLRGPTTGVTNLDGTISQGIAAPAIEDGPTSLYPDPTTLGDVDLSALGGGEVNEVANAIPTEPLNLHGTSAKSTLDMTAASENRKKQTRKRRVAQSEEAGDVRATIEAQPNKPRKAGLGRKASEKKKKEPKERKKRRAVTPEGAELDKIEPSVIKMAELCQDLRIGKKFSKHDEIKQRDIQRKAKAKLATLNPELAAPEDELGRRGSDTANVEADDAEVRPGLSAGPQMRVIDGQIVLDDSTLVLDRQKRAAAEGMTMEEVEENDFTRVVTSATYMKREKAQAWDAAAEEIFYKGLRMFGTDFQTISKMFPHRNRRQIKLKFNREERVNPDKITKALVGERITIDMEEYQSLTGLQYEEVADIEAERARIDKEHEEEAQARLAELAEITRQKKAAIHANAGGRGGDSSKENNPGADDEDGKASAASKSKKKSAKSKKKNMHSVGGGGEEVEVLGTIA